jgi:uncharacterized Zn finger protein
MGRMLSTTGKKKGDIIVCPKCEGESFNMVAHWDGRKSYGYTYNCVNCGTPVNVEFERDKASIAYWE